MNTVIPGKPGFFIKLLKRIPLVGDPIEGVHFEYVPQSESKKMNENRKLALKEYFKDKFLNVDFAKAFEAGWDAAMKHYFQCGKEELQSIQSGNWLDPDVWRSSNKSVCEPEPDGWLVWDQHIGRVFIEHQKGVSPSEVRLKLEQLGKPVLGAVVFKDWPCEATPKT